MQAVILAGGVGSRLGNHSNGLPKCVVEFGGRPLIHHQLRTLADNGVGPVLIVAGYQADAVRAAIGTRAEYLVNDLYEQTNSLYSFWLARDWIKGPFVLLNCDLLFHPDILNRILRKEGNVLAYDSTASNGLEQTKVAIRKNRVVDLGKDLPVTSARGESLGLIKFDAEGARAVLAQADELIKGGNEKSWVTEAVRSCCSQIPIIGVNVAGSPWVELDYPHDLEEARKEVWPEICKSRSRKRARWNQIRWAAFCIVAMALVCAGWYANSYVGPASLDWVTVNLPAAEKVMLNAANPPRKWWIVKRGEPVTAEVDGGRSLRVETRTIQASQDQISAKCVCEIAVDNKPSQWVIVSGAPDPTATLPGFVIGERARVQFGLPPGPHVLRLATIAGTCDRVLVRVRQLD